MAFILFPVFVLIMVIAVIISYNRLTGMRKKLDTISKNILLLHKEYFDLIKSASINLLKTFPDKNELLENLHQQLTHAEAHPARNLFTSTQYYRSLRNVQEELLVDAENQFANHTPPDFKDKESIIFNELKKHIKSYNLLVVQFDKSLNQFPNNLLAGMAGWEPYKLGEM